VRPWSTGRKSRSNILAGSAWSLASWLLSAATAFPLQVILVRLMSPSSFGTYALATGISTFVVPFATFGLQGSVARQAAQALTSEEHQGLSMVVRTATRVAAYLTVFVLVTVVGVSLIMSRIPSLSSAVLVFLALAPVALVAPLGDAVMGLIQATFQPKIPLMSGVFRSGLLLALTSSLLVAGFRSAVPVAAAQSVAVGSSVVVLVLWSGWPGQLRTRPERSLSSKRFMTFGLAALANTTFFVAVSQLDVVFLGGFHGSAGAGAYAPVSGIADAIGTLFATLACYALPAMTAARTRGKDADLLDLTRWISRWGLVLCAPVLGLMAAVPGPLLHLLFGNRSAGMVLPARILAIGLIINLVLGFNTYAILALGQPRVLARNALVGLVVSVIACVTLIPRLGAIGAAAATAIAILVVNGLASSFLWHRVKFAPWDRPLALTVVAFAAGTGAAVLLSQLVADDLGRLAVAAGLAGIPTLAISVLVGGAADRELLTAALNIIHQKLRPGFREPNRSQGVAQWPLAPGCAASTAQPKRPHRRLQRPHRPRHGKPRTLVRLAHRRSFFPSPLCRKMWISGGRHSLRYFKGTSSMTDQGTTLTFAETPATHPADHIDYEYCARIMGADDRGPFIQVPET
jgi:O-antigen/teichoic acid export membrane protein